MQQVEFDINQFVDLLLQRLQQSQHACRLFHGRGGCYQRLNGLNIDYYPPYLHWRCYQPIDCIEQVAQLLEQAGIEKHRHIIQQRYSKPIKQFSLAGELPDQVRCQELQVSYDVNFHNQNSGIFLDMYAGRAWLAEFVRQRADCKVLNLFAYTCAFSLVACQAGAELVVNVDMSAGVLKQGQKNHQLNQFTNSVRFLKHNVMKSFGKLSRLADYDVIVVDPPTFQKGSFDAKRHYQKLARKLFEFPASDYLFCLNDPQVSVDEFRSWIEQDSLSYQLVARVANPEWIEEVDERFSLKVLHYKKSY